MLRALGTGIRTLGKGIRILGACCLFAAAIIGTLAIDIVLLCCLLNSRASPATFFFSGLILGMFTLNMSDTYQEPLTILLSSVATTLIGIILACALGMPMVGAFLAAAWVLAIIVIASGLVIELLGDSMMSCSETDDYSDYDVEDSSYQHMAGHFPSHAEMAQPEVVAGVALSPLSAKRPPASNPYDVPDSTVNSAQVI